MVIHQVIHQVIVKIMAVKTRSQLLADNAALFVTNTTGNITPPLEKAFNDDTLDSVALIPVVIAANETALNDQSYVVVANATFTDPSPVEGKGFSVLVRNGTATIGGTAYSVAGTIIIRIFHSGGWANFTPENVANKATNFSTANNTLYPSVQATRTEIRAGITQIVTAPTVNDDVDLGYIVGSRVIAQDTQIEWLCTNNSDGAAVWIPSGNISFAINVDSAAIQAGTAIDLTPFIAVTDYYWHITISDVEFIAGTTQSTETIGVYCEGLSDPQWLFNMNLASDIFASFTNRKTNATCFLKNEKMQLKFSGTSGLSVDSTMKIYVTGVLIKWVI